MRPSRAAKAHCPKKLQSKAVIPVLIAQLQKITALGCPGIVDQNIYAPESLNGRRNNLRRSLGFAKVGNMHEAFAANGGNCLMEQVSRTSDQYKAHMLFCEFLSNGPSNTTTCTGDDGHLIRQL